LCGWLVCITSKPWKSPSQNKSVHDWKYSVMENRSLKESKNEINA
jgi:hypothetical protein